MDAWSGVKDLWSDGYNFGDITGSITNALFGDGGLSDQILGISYGHGNPISERSDLFGGIVDFFKNLFGLDTGTAKAQRNDAWNEAIAESVRGNSDELNYLSQQAHSAPEAIDLLKKLAEEDENYRSLYLTLLAERENTDQAWKRYEEYNKNYYSMIRKSLEDAGLNPWLALQNLGNPGTGSINPAGFSGSSLSSMIQAQNSSSRNNIGLLAALAVLLKLFIK